MKPIAIELIERIRGYDSIAPIYFIEIGINQETRYWLMQSNGGRGGHLSDRKVRDQPEKYRFVYSDITPLLEEAETLLEEIGANPWLLNTGERPFHISGETLIEVKYVNSGLSNTTLPLNKYYWHICSDDGYAIKEYRKAQT